MFKKISVISITFAFLSVPAMAQSDINPQLGYYFWDIVATAGEEDRAYNFDDGTSVSKSYEYDSARLEYLYDFCGKSNMLLGFSMEQQKMNEVGNDDAKKDTSEFMEVFFGLRGEAGDFADYYLRVGQIKSKGRFLEDWGNSFEERTSLEIGFRSRVGERRNFELTNKLRYDDLYQLQMEVGFLYHAAASFSFGIGYKIKGDVSEQPAGTNLSSEARNSIVDITGQDEAAITLRINI